MGKGAQSGRSPSGSSSWCRPMGSEFVPNNEENEGAVDYLKELEKQNARAISEYVEKHRKS